MKTERIPLMFLPSGIGNNLSKKVMGLGHAMAKALPTLQSEINETDLDVTAGKYMALALVNALFWFVLFSPLLFFVAYAGRGASISYSLLLGFGSGFAIFMLFFLIYMQYPKITAGKKAEHIDKNLVFALKDLLLQISSGVSLYNSLINIAKAKYGIVSDEFEEIAQKVSTGKPMDKALEEAALHSKSEYFKRTIWQVVNTLKAGASLKGALQTIIADLTIDQRSRIRDYAQELNLWSLIYMLFAVAIPTIGVTMLVILSSFAGFNITPVTFIMFLVLNFCVQVALIGFVKSRRPLINF